MSRSGNESTKIMHVEQMPNAATMQPILYSRTCRIRVISAVAFRRWVGPCGRAYQNDGLTRFSIRFDGISMRMYPVGARGALCVWWVGGSALFRAERCGASRWEHVHVHGPM